MFSSEAFWPLLVRTDLIIRFLVTLPPPLLRINTYFLTGILIPISRSFDVRLADTHSLRAWHPCDPCLIPPDWISGRSTGRYGSYNFEARTVLMPDHYSSSFLIRRSPYRYSPYGSVTHLTSLSAWDIELSDLWVGWSEVYEGLPTGRTSLCRTVPLPALFWTKFRIFLCSIR